MPAEAVDERARRDVPHVHDGVEQASGNEAHVGRDRHARHARVDVGVVVDREHFRPTHVHVSYPRRLVARARDDERAVVRKGERVDFLLVALERVPIRLREMSHIYAGVSGRGISRQPEIDGSEGAHESADPLH
jgi:hypothetical protein